MIDSGFILQKFNNGWIDKQKQQQILWQQQQISSSSTTTTMHPNTYHNLSIDNNYHITLV